MAAPMESVAFCNINETDFLSVSEAYTEDTVIVSSRKKLCDVYKISDQKSVKSWSVRHGMTLTSPVVWVPQLHKFVTVTNNQDVRLWDKDATDFEKSKKKHSNDKVHEVMHSNGHEPVMLYSNGAVDLLSKIKDNHSSGPLSNKQEIFWCKTAQVRSTLMVLFAVVTKKGTELHVNKYNSDKDVWKHTVVDVPQPGRPGKLCSCDAAIQSHSVNVFFLWTDGRLSCMTVKQDTSSPGPCHTVPGSTSNTSILALDDLHLAVAGVKRDTEDGLGIFDTKFGLVKSWQPFPDKCQCKPKICKVRDELFLSCGTTLYRYSYGAQPSTVVSLLGQSNITDTTKTVPGHYIWNPNGKISSKSKPSTHLADLLSKLTDKSLGYTHFKEVFDKLSTELKKIENRHWLKTSHMTTLLQRMMGEKKFWAQEEMNRLISLKCIPMSILDELFSFLVEKSEISMLHAVLITLPNIPERCLCRALSFFLQCDEEKLPCKDMIMDINSDDDNCGAADVAGDDADDDNKSPPCPISSNRASIINEILFLPYSDIFLLECLRKVQFKDALKLLKYLCYLLETRCGLLKVDDGLSRIQVVDWVCLVLDAHITQFVLSPDCHVTIVKLESIVTEQVQFFDGLVTLEALLEHFKAKSSLPQDKKIGQYCIEVLHVH